MLDSIAQWLAEVMAGISTVISALFDGPWWPEGEDAPLRLVGVGLVLLALLGVVGLLLYRVLTGARLAWHALLRDLRLSLHGKGRQGLRLAGEMRSGSRRIMRDMRQEIADPAEQKELKAVVATFVGTDLPHLLDRLAWVLERCEDRRARKLRALHDARAQQWGQASSNPERETLNEEIADIRQQLARVDRMLNERARLLSGLGDAATALKSLEEELIGLRVARAEDSPRFHEHINQLSEDLRFLREAHLELSK